MEPTGVRMSCPDCTWDCVMKSEGDIPDEVTKVVEGVPYCPNCNLPMKPIASVDTTPRPASGISAATTLEQIAAKCVEIQREVAELGEDLEEKKGSALEGQEGLRGEARQPATGHRAHGTRARR